AIYSGDGSFATSTGSLSGGQLVGTAGGNVTATLDLFYGVLRITGDTGNNAITIAQDSSGVLQIAGAGTLVNQSSNPVTFSSVTEIDISLLNGDDSVTMNNCTIPG